MIVLTANIFSASQGIHSVDHKIALFYIISEPRPIFKVYLLMLRTI